MEFENDNKNGVDQTNAINDTSMDITTFTARDVSMT